LVDAEVVKVECILSSNLLEIVFQEHGHVVDKVLRLALLVDQALYCCLLMILPNEIQLNEHLTLVFQILLVLLSVYKLLQMLVLLRNVSQKQSECDGIQDV
jgi:general stress protein CsbA